MNSSVLKIGPKLECLEGEDQNCNVKKDKNRIPMFGRIRSDFLNI